MQDYLFIFLGTQATLNIYFKVFDAPDIYFKKLLAPPPQLNCSSPNKKRDQFQPFPNSIDCHTKHIAMLHGLWPSLKKNQVIDLELCIYRNVCYRLA